MGEHLARLLRDETAFGHGHPPAAMDDGPFAADGSRLNGDGPKEVHLRLEGCVTLAPGERGVDRAAEGGVEKGHRESAVDDSNRVIEKLARLAAKHGPHLFGLGPDEAHRHGYWRRRKPALEHGADVLQ